MAHVTLVEQPRGVIARLSDFYARRRFGRPVEPGMAAAHHAGVLVAMGALENFRSRFNGGLGLESRGFSGSCDVSPIGEGAGMAGVQSGT